MVVSGSSPPHLDVIDALDGFARLTRRSPTLDGSVPLRVVQGCLPFLEGNAWGLQVGVGLGWRVRRSWQGWRVEPLTEHDSSAGWGLPRSSNPGFQRHEALQRLFRARLRALVARGSLPEGEPWGSLSSVVSVERGLRATVLRVATGLLVRPAAGLVVRVARTANRGAWPLDVVETVITDSVRHTPLVLVFRVPTGIDEFRVEGDLATLSVLPTGTVWRCHPLEARPELAAAHLAFYSPDYFAAKRAGEVTRKYRKLVSEGGGAPPRAGPELVEAGPVSYRLGGKVAAVDVSGWREVSSPYAVATFVNEVAFTARYDGARVALSWDRPALDRRAEAIRERWEPFVGENDRGALWYLTKYFTPHPVGEAHFFVKPAAFVATPPGWSSVVEGPFFATHEVLRGVVHTDRFHAVPAVFALHGERVAQMPSGTPLLRVMPTPKELLAPSVALHRFEEE
jgi:hypothetical protein